MEASVLFEICRGQHAIDISAYGALGDGVADDTNAINRAIAAAGNGTLYFLLAINLPQRQATKYHTA